METLLQRVSGASEGISTARFLFRLLRSIPESVKRFEPDLILFSSMVTAGVAPFLRNRIDTPMVAINHGQDVTLPVRIYQIYLRRIFRSMDRVISVSEATRDASVARGLDPAKVVVLPNGLDAEFSGRLPDREQARRDLARLFGIDFSAGRRLLLSVGRLVERKGHSWFVREVFPKLTIPADYLIIGDGPGRGKLHRSAGRSNLRDRIYLAGRQPEEVLLSAYSAADLFVMPNIPVKGDMEGFGIVLLEANQSGLPAVAADLEGIRDVIREGVNGYLVPPGDAARFADRVDRSLIEGREALSEKAKKYVLEKYDWNKVVGDYVSVLEKTAFG